MSDAVITDRAELEEVVGNLGTVTVIRAGNERDDPDAPYGDLRYPAEVADAIWTALTARWREKLKGPPVILPPPPGDRELNAMATIAEQLTGLDNPDAVSRILRYFNDRYGDGDD